jgi:hypothetical protein
MQGGKGPAARSHEIALALEFLEVGANGDFGYAEFPTQEGDGQGTLVGKEAEDSAFSLHQFFDQFRNPFEYLAIYHLF